MARIRCGRRQARAGTGLALLVALLQHGRPGAGRG